MAGGPCVPPAQRREVPSAQPPGYHGEHAVGEGLQSAAEQPSAGRGQQTPARVDRFRVVGQMWSACKELNVSLNSTPLLAWKTSYTTWSRLVVTAAVVISSGSSRSARTTSASRPWRSGQMTWQGHRAGVTKGKGAGGGAGEAG